MTPNTTIIDVYKRQELFLITRNHRYLDFADAFTGRFVREDGSIESYDPKEYNLDHVNAGKTLFDLYKLTGKEKYRRAMDTVYSLSLIHI